MTNFKWTDEKIINYIEENALGYHLTNIERGAKSGKTRVYLTCDKNHEYDVNFDNFQKGKRCPYCCGNIKFKYKDIKNFIEVESNSGCTLISETYLNTDSKLEIECECGNKYLSSFYKFKYDNKRTCNECSNLRLSEKFRSSIEYVANQIELLSGGNVRLFSKEYVNGKTPITLLCSCTKTFDVKYNDFLSNKQYQCPDCGFQKRADSKRLDPLEVKNEFELHGYKLLSDYFYSDEQLLVECPNGHNYSVNYNSFNRGTRCQKCYHVSMGGENHYAWKGGISPLSEYLRKHITEWKNESKKLSEYKCVITKDKFSVIHHLFSFSSILQETLEELNLPIHEEINKYSNEELESIRLKCLEIHYRYPFGVCLREDVHYLFHSLYGKNNNTPEQFKEFSNRYFNGEFNEIVTTSEAI